MQRKTAIILGTRAEARKVNEEIGDCAAKHIIKECNIELEI